MWRLLFDVFGVVMTVYMNWKNTCTDVTTKKVKKKKSNKQANKKYFSHVSVSAMSSFNLIKEFKLVKKYDKVKNGFNVCFQNKANVPITIIHCGVYLLRC